MAGLQYYFFPTDFYYPRPKPVAETNPADGNVNADVDPRAAPSSQPVVDRNTNPEKMTALVDSDVKKPLGNPLRKALVLSPREIGEVSRRLQAVVADSRSKPDRYL